MSIWLDVDNLFVANDVTGAVTMLEQFLTANEAHQFACLVGANFSNTHQFVVDELNRFAAATSDKFKVKAIYLEMNGFDLNYDRWYFDLFAYENEPVDEDQLDWLCDWQSEPWPGVELTGMGDQQAAFAWYHDKQAWNIHRTIRAVYEAAMLLIMSKFVQFIGEALQTAKFNYAIPVFVTAHGFESIARYAGNERVARSVAS